MNAAGQMRLLRVAVAGDEFYIAEDRDLAVPLQRQLHSYAHKYDGKLKTKYFLATDLSPETAHRIVRVTIIREFRS